jgi:hypothetical protein
MKAVAWLFIFIAVISFSIFIIDILEYAKIKKKSERKSKIIIFSIFLLSTCALSISVSLFYSDYFLANADKIEINYSKAGAYGDLIGGIMNPVIALIGIIAASLAFYAQYKANQQVQEQFTKQEKKDYIQNFENKLFKLIEFQNQIVQDIDMDIWIFNDKIINEIISNNPLEEKKYLQFHENYFDENDNLVFKELELKSRDSFKFSFELLDNLLSISNQLLKLADSGELADDESYQEHFKIVTDNFEKKSITYNQNIVEDFFCSIYDLVFSKINIDLGHYYRNLYRIFKIIDEASFDEDKKADFKIKYQYASIVRSQLSDYEIYFLFYNGLSDYGISKFKKLIEKYSLLKIIPRNNKKLEFHIYKNLYDKKAFGN